MSSFDRHTKQTQTEDPKVLKEAKEQATDGLSAGLADLRAYLKVQLNVPYFYTWCNSPPTTAAIEEVISILDIGPRSDVLRKVEKPVG